VTQDREKNQIFHIVDQQFSGECSYEMMTKDMGMTDDEYWETTAKSADKTFKDISKEIVKKASLYVDEWYKKNPKNGYGFKQEKSDKNEFSVFDWLKKVKVVKSGLSPEQVYKGLVPQYKKSMDFISHFCSLNPDDIKLYLENNLQSSPKYKKGFSNFVLNLLSNIKSDPDCLAVNEFAEHKKLVK
jgi:hypothetical protein